MSKDDAEDHIRTENADAHSIDEQVEIAHAMWNEPIDPSHDGLKRTNLEDELGLDLTYNPGTSLDHLTGAGMVEEFRPPGPETLVIADWRDEGIVNGEVDEAAVEGLEALIEHMQDDDPVDEGDTHAVADGARPTIRSVVAERFDYASSALEDFLRDGDPVGKLNGAVEAIKEHDEVSKRDDYDEIAFINMPHRYRLTQMAVDLYER